MTGMNKKFNMALIFILLRVDFKPAMLENNQTEESLIIHGNLEYVPISDIRQVLT
jgi:hypothetical protein